jgi:hypothetical protein
MAALRLDRGCDATVQCRDGHLSEIWYYFNVAGSAQTGVFEPAEPGGFLYILTGKLSNKHKMATNPIVINEASSICQNFVPRPLRLPRQVRNQNRLQPGSLLVDEDTQTCSLMASDMAASSVAARGIRPEPVQDSWLLS